MVLYDGTHGTGSRARVVQDTRYTWYTTKLGAYQKNTTKFEKNTTQSIELAVFFSKLVVFFFGTGVWVRSCHMTVPYRTLIP